MKVSLRFAVAYLDTGQRHGESNQGIRTACGLALGNLAVEGAENLAAYFLREKKCLAGNAVALVIAPGLDLQIGTGLHLLQSRARANLDHGLAFVADLAGTSKPGVSSVESFFFACAQSA